MSSPCPDAKHRLEKVLLGRGEPGPLASDNEPAQAEEASQPINR